jgi:hypothetical protein
MEDVFENDGQLFLACADNGSWQAVVILMTRYDLQRVGPTPDDLRPVTYFVADLATIQQYSPGFKHFWQGHIAEQHE